MNIPERFRNVSLDSYVAHTTAQQRAKATVWDYMTHLNKNLSEGRGITFYGNVGTGKTHLAICVLMEAAKLGLSGYFVTEDGMFDRFKKDWNDPDEEFKFLSQIQKVRFLVIDDMGIRRSSDYVSDRYEAVINTRYAKNIPTIITSNKSPNELAQVYDRQMSRLSGNVEIQVTGPDARKHTPKPENG